MCVVFDPIVRGNTWSWGFSIANKTVTPPEDVELTADDTFTLTVKANENDETPLYTATLPIVQGTPDSVTVVVPAAETATWPLRNVLVQVDWENTGVTPFLVTIVQGTLLIKRNLAE
jgi:hypothetical protein